MKNCLFSYTEKLCAKFSTVLARTNVYFTDNTNIYSSWLRMLLPWSRCTERWFERKYERKTNWNEVFPGSCWYTVMNWKLIWEILLDYGQNNSYSSWDMYDLRGEVLKNLLIWAGRPFFFYSFLKKRKKGERKRILCCIVYSNLWNRLMSAVDFFFFFFKISI